MSVPEATAGQVRCPECMKRFAVPEEEPETAEELPAEEDPPPPPKSQRPKKKPRAKRGRGVSPLLLVGVGTVLVTAGIVGVLALTGALSGPKPAPVAGPAPQPAPPDPKPPGPPVQTGPAPAPEEADPLRPAAPSAATAVAVFDKLADRLPAVPQDADRAKALRAARLEWSRKTMDQAFDRVGRADAPWAEKARSALLLRAQELAAFTEFSVRPDLVKSASAAALADAVAAGCDDPLVLYYHNKAIALAGSIPRDRFLEESRRVTLQMWDSKYPDVRKLYAVHNFLAALREYRGPADEVATWEKRFWELLERLCKDEDALTQEHVIELAELRERFAMSGGGSREQAHKEFAVFLARSKAPEYTQLVVKGAFLIRHGWDARGSGVAGTVTPEGFRLLAERLEEAETALTEAYDLIPDRAHAPTRMLTVCMGRSHPKATMEKWFERAMKADPDNISACLSKLEFVHPKWYGSEDELIGFAWQCVRTRNTAGMLPFAAVLSITGNAPIPGPITPAVMAPIQTYYSHPHVWHLLDAALSVQRRDTPEQLWLRGRHTRLACVAGQYAVAARELAAVGDDHVGGGFRSAADLAFYRTWVRESRLPPR